MIVKIFSILLLLFTIIGCSTSIRVKDISANVQDIKARGQDDHNELQQIHGIPFRMKETYTINIYKKYGEKYKKKGQLVQNLPDPKRLFAVNFKAKQFADQKLQLDFRNDSTISALDLSTTLKFDKALKSLGNNAVNVANALVELEKTKEEAKVSEFDKKKKELTEQKEMLALEAEILNAQENLRTAQRDATKIPLLESELDTSEKERLMEDALRALQDAEAAELALNTLPQDAKPEELLGAQAALRLARLKANHAFRKAGLEAPFPDAFPN